MTQLWVAMCMYLLLAYLKFVMRLRWSLHQMLQVLQLNMFERRPLQDLFTTPSLPAPSGPQLGSPQTSVGRLRRDRRVGEGCWPARATSELTAHGVHLTGDGRGAPWRGQVRAE